MMATAMLTISGGVGDFANNDNSVFDPDERDEYGYLNDNHGTHCAGTIGAQSDNSMGVTGINWNVRIMPPLKFIGPPGGGYTSDAILALQYAADKGAQIASCSWGGTIPTGAQGRHRSIGHARCMRGGQLR